MLIQFNYSFVFSAMPHGRPKKKQTSREKQSSSAPPVMESPRKQLKWTNQSMVAAIKVVVEGSSSINKAAMEYRVPRTTLQERITGEFFMELNAGQSLILTKQKKNELTEFLRTTAEVKLESK